MLIVYLCFLVSLIDLVAGELGRFEYAPDSLLGQGFYLLQQFTLLFECLNKVDTMTVHQVLTN